MAGRNDLRMPGSSYGNVGSGGMTLPGAILATILSAVLLAVSFPEPGLPMFAWVSLVPLFLLIRRSTPAKAALHSLCVCCLFYAALMRWTLSIKSIGILNFLIIDIVNGWHFVVFAVFAQYVARRNTKWIPLTFPSIWVVLEYLKSHAGPLSFPWGILGYSQFTVLPVARISTITGVYGVSFLIVAVNASLAEMILNRWSLRERETVCRLDSLRERFGVPLMILAGTAILTALYQFGSSSVQESREGSSLKTALIQGNIYFDEKPDRRYQERVMRTYERLTMQAAGSKPDLIVWPSSSVPGRIPYDRMLVAEIARIARGSASYLLIGSAGYDKFEENQRKTKRVANSAFLFSPGGEILGRYDKMRLLPFDEYLPFRRYLKWPSWIVSPGITDHHAGTEMTIFRTDKARFGVLICWENFFPEQFREMASKGVDFMVGMTNEGFAPEPVGHRQMMAFYVFRAIENHVPVVRIASTGVSALISPEGRIIERVKDESGKDVDVEGFLAGELPLSSSRTFYSRHGDLFLAVPLILLLMTFGFRGGEFLFNGPAFPWGIGKIRSGQGHGD